MRRSAVDDPLRADGLGSHHVKRAYCGVGEPDPSLEVDFSCDIVPAMDRFPILPLVT